MRKIKFYDIPVHEKTRENLKKYKKQKNLSSYDAVMENLLKNIGDFDLGGI
jgi:hypothetical protein